MPNQIHFSDAEISLMYDAALFERKRMVNQKIFLLFENIRIRLKDSSQHKQFPFPAGVDRITGKISQGENYLGCPWVMLDFPKMFNKDTIFAYRTMFWYGNYFSSTLVVSGELATVFLPKLLDRIALLPADTWFSVHPDPWYHAIDIESAVPIAQVTPTMIREQVEAYGFFKLSRKWTGSDFQKIGDEVVLQYENVLKTLL